VLPFLVTSLWLQHQKKLVKKEVKAMILADIEKGQLERLQFSKEESANLLEWKHSKEFAFEGNMYDIVETEQCGDSIIYWCWLDKKETALNQQLAGLLEELLGTKQERSEKKNRLNHFSKTLFFATGKIELSFVELKCSDKIPFFSESILQGYRQNGVPPPETMV
jgi:hypothetical protein